jgi:hypothetical protein
MRPASCGTGTTAARANFASVDSRGTGTPQGTVRRRQGVNPVALVASPLEETARCFAQPLIPNPIDQNPWAHWRSPMDMMRQG